MSPTTAVQQVSSAPCPGCGKTDFHTAYSGPEGNRMKETGECWECAFWEIRCNKGEKLVINHNVYGVGPEPRDPKTGYKSALGMGGRRFDIELFTGERFTTHNLWSGGEIPEKYRDRLPDTATFLGAERAKVGDMTCWNSSPESAPAYPTYATVMEKKS